jgi:excisionase family DNA binding protein
MHQPDFDPMRDAPSQLPRLLTPREAALALRKSTRTLRRWMGLGMVCAIRPAGGRPLIPRAEVERLLREGAR